MKIRTLIVDDEPLARERIRTLLEEAPDVTIIGECAHGREAVEAIEEHRPDLVFLDVQMPELDGFGVVEAVGTDRMPTVVFVTAYNEFALRAFDAHALDYLLKPFDRERFARTLDRARSQLHRQRDDELDERLRGLLRDLQPEQEYLERLVIRSGARILFARTEEVDWIEAEGNYARLHIGKRSHLLRETMSGLEAKLDPRQFVRIHRSTIVNITRIKEMESVFQGEYLIVLEDGTRLTSSRGYRDRLQELLQTG